MQQEIIRKTKRGSAIITASAGMKWKAGSSAIVRMGQVPEDVLRHGRVYSSAGVSGGRVVVATEAGEGSEVWRAHAWFIPDEECAAYRAADPVAPEAFFPGVADGAKLESVAPSRWEEKDLIKRAMKAAKDIFCGDVRFAARFISLLIRQTRGKLGYNAIAVRIPATVRNGSFKAYCLMEFLLRRFPVKMWEKIGYRSLWPKAEDSDRFPVFFSCADMIGPGWNAGCATINAESGKDRLREDPVPEGSITYRLAEALVTGDRDAIEQMINETERRLSETESNAPVSDIQEEDAAREAPAEGEAAENTPSEIPSETLSEIPTETSSEKAEEETSSERAGDEEASSEKAGDGDATGEKGEGEADDLFEVAPDKPKKAPPRVNFNGWAADDPRVRQQLDADELLNAVHRRRYGERYGAESSDDWSRFWSGFVGSSGEFVSDADMSRAMRAAARAYRESIEKEKPIVMYGLLSFFHLYFTEMAAMGEETGDALSDIRDTPVMDDIFSVNRYGAREVLVGILNLIRDCFIDDGTAYDSIRSDKALDVILEVRQVIVDDLSRRDLGVVLDALLAALDALLADYGQPAAKTAFVYYLIRLCCQELRIKPSTSREIPTATFMEEHYQPVYKRYQELHAALQDRRKETKSKSDGEE